MLKKSDYEAAINNAKLKTRKIMKQRKQKRNDVSGEVTIETGKQTLKTFTLRLPEQEQKDMKKLIDKVNKHSPYKKVSGNDVIRALLIMAKKMNSERLYKAAKEL